MIDKRRVAVVGSRKVPGDSESVALANEVRRQMVADFIAKLSPRDHVVVSGGASGVDTWAVEAADALGIQTRVIRPKWEQYGKSAGFRRNKEIVADADDVVAFWDGESRGTEHTIKLAIEAGKHVAVFSFITGELIRSVVPSHE